MRVTLTLCLPRDEMSIPVARHVVKATMENVGVESDSVHDVEIALTEACNNVLQHSGPGDEYEVSFELGDGACSIRVVDRGSGFDFASLSETARDLSAERGRGITLMQALVDRVKFVSRPEAGTIVHLEKALDYSREGLLAKSARDAKSG